jgi:hypothetical protein
MLIVCNPDILPATTHNLITILLCELFILRLAGHNTIADAASGARVLRRVDYSTKESNYQLKNMQQQTHTTTYIIDSQFCCNFFPHSTFLSASLLLFLPFEGNWSLFHCLDQLFRLRVVMNINEKKYGVPEVESLRRTSYDMIRRAASKSTDDVVLIKTVLISAYYAVRHCARCEYSG